ncbi:hypothetical protein FRC16_003949 [Serendipita sp. 398]|nr:hypothetical protein FRC16_003949 [Serendipita sp. 398]
MWSLVPTKIGQLRSTELRETLQSKTKGGGWQILEFDGTTESARAIAQAQREGPNAASCTNEHADNGETPGVTEANTVFSKRPELSPKKKEAKFKLFPLQGNSAAKRLPSSDTAKYGITRDDKIIIIMGPTGVGKSTVSLIPSRRRIIFLTTLQFIDYATGRNGQGIGHTLKSSTQGIVVRKTVVGGQSIAFVDTPGFDDTVRSDYEILGVIAEFFISVHKDGLQMEKIFYLHRISDNRVSGTPLRNLELFASMCGNIAMPTVTIVTTMWSLVTGNLGQQRMASLCATFWKTMADGGCDIVQFEDSVDSAHEIALRPKPDPKRTLLTQELIDKGKRLNATEAGIMLSRQLERLIAEEKEASLRLEQLSRQQMNPAAKRALEYELNVMKESIEEKASELGKLNRSLLDIVLGLFSKSVSLNFAVFSSLKSTPESAGCAGPRWIYRVVNPIGLLVVPMSNYLVGFKNAFSA